MVVQFPGDPFSNILKDTSKKAEATEDQYDRILQSVLEEIGQPGAASYAKAASTVDRMASANVNRMVNRVIASGTGVAVLAASLFLVISANMAPANPVSIPDNTTPLARDPRGYVVETPAVLPGENQPVWESVTVDEQFITIYLSNISDQDIWHSIHGIDLAGARVEPAETNIEQGYVKFTLPVERLELYFEDSAGNSQKMLP